MQKVYSHLFYFVSDKLFNQVCTIHVPKDIDEQSVKKCLLLLIVHSEFVLLCIVKVTDYVFNYFSVISTLEKLKNEASEIMHKVEETDKVMGEVEMVSQQYMPLSQACSSIYFTLEGLHQVSSLEMIIHSRAFALFDSF